MTIPVTAKIRRTKIQSSGMNFMGMAIPMAMQLTFKRVVDVDTDCKIGYPTWWPETTNSQWERGQSAHQGNTTIHLELPASNQLGLLSIRTAGNATIPSPADLRRTRQIIQFPESNR